HCAIATFTGSSENFCEASSSTGGWLPILFSPPIRGAISVISTVISKLLCTSKCDSEAGPFGVAATSRLTASPRFSSKTSSRSPGSEVLVLDAMLPLTVTSLRFLGFSVVERLPDSRKCRRRHETPTGMLWSPASAKSRESSLVKRVHFQLIRVHLQ